MCLCCSNHIVSKHADFEVKFFLTIFFFCQNVVLNWKMAPFLNFFFPATFWKRLKLVIKEGLREVEKKTKKKLFLKKVWVTLMTFPSPSWLKIVLSSYFLICHPTISVLFYSSEFFFLNFKVKTSDLWSLFLRLFRPRINKPRPDSESACSKDQF